MDIRKIRKLIELIDETGVMEIEIKEGEESVRINRGSPATSQPYSTPLMAPPPAYHAPMTCPTIPNPFPPASNTPALPEGKSVNSPMVGTFYTASAPGSPAFVQTGDTVKKGQVLCIIEAMKMMNQIEAEIEGTVKACLVDNGAPVEFGQPLFIID